LPRVSVFGERFLIVFRISPANSCSYPLTAGVDKEIELTPSEHCARNGMTLPMHPRKPTIASGYGNRVSISILLQASVQNV
jgi:hypothetical protein